jgi:hypothetical protein
MKHFGCAWIVVLSLLLVTGLSGCEPDAAIRRGAVIGGGSSASERGVRQPDKPIITQPKIEVSQPLKKVQ